MIKYYFFPGKKSRGLIQNKTILQVDTRTGITSYLYPYKRYAFKLSYWELERYPSEWLVSLGAKKI